MGKKVVSENISSVMCFFVFGVICIDVSCTIIVLNHNYRQIFTIRICEATTHSITTTVVIIVAIAFAVTISVIVYN